jgi:hypothetical protein
MDLTGIRQKVFLDRYALKDKQGNYRFFRSWGGEALYLDLENKPELRKIGTPCIVVGSLKFGDFEHYTSLSKRMICIFLNHRYYSHDSDFLVKNKSLMTQILGLLV